MLDTGVSGCTHVPNKKDCTAKPYFPAISAPFFFTLFIFFITLATLYTNLIWENYYFQRFKRISYLERFKDLKI